MKLAKELMNNLTLATAREIEIDLIDPNPQQPRRNFDQAKLEELAASIRENGVIQPIIVESAAAYGRDGRYIIHDGERRLRAAKLAGLNTIPAVVVGTPGGTDKKNLLLRATVANIQRADLNAIETARAYQELADEGMSDQEIAAAVGKSRSKIANSRRLLRLPDDMLAAVEAGQVSERAGLAYLPALDIKPHLMDGAGLTNKVDFSYWETPTPNALRKRILSDDSLTSTKIRKIVKDIEEKTTSRPCANCGVDTRKTTWPIEDEDKHYCRDCWQNEITEARYCVPVAHKSLIKKIDLEANKTIKCPHCRNPEYEAPAQEWLTFIPHDCPACGEKKAEIIPIENTVTCHACGQKWTIGDYHAVAATKPKKTQEVKIVAHKCKYWKCPAAHNRITVNTDEMICTVCGARHHETSSGDYRLIPGEEERLDQIHRETTIALSNATRYFVETVIKNPDHLLKLLFIGTARNDVELAEILNRHRTTTDMRFYVARWFTRRFFNDRTGLNEDEFNMYLRVISPDLGFKNETPSPETVEPVAPAAEPNAPDDAEIVDKFKARLNDIKKELTDELSVKQLINRNMKLDDLYYHVNQVSLNDNNSTEIYGLLANISKLDGEIKNRIHVVRAQTANVETP